MLMHTGIHQLVLLGRGRCLEGRLTISPRPPMKLAALALLVLTFTAAHGQDYWHGPTGFGATGLWSNGANWSGGVPGPSDNVVIYYGGGYAVAVLDTSPNIQSLTLGGPQLVGGNNVLEDGPPYSPLALTISGSLNVGQNGILDTTNVNILVGADSVNNGAIGIDCCSLSINGNFDNRGQLSTAVNSYGAGVISISGTLTNEASGILGIYQPGASIVMGSLVNYGLLYSTSGGTFSTMRFDNFPTTFWNMQGTMIVGTGATSNPGYYQFADGFLGEHIDASGFGVVPIPSGAVSLNGTLDIELANGFNPPVGSSYDIITFTPDNLTGTFSNVMNIFFNGGTEKWDVIYNNSGGYVELLAQPSSPEVPEPSSLLLLGSGLAGLAAVAQRKLLPR